MDKEDWKQLATTFQNLGTAPSQHRDGFFITLSLSVSRTKTYNIIIGCVPCTHKRPQMYATRLGSPDAVYEQ